MDPLVAIGAANSANTALRTATGTVRAAWRRLQLVGTFDPDWIDLGLEDGPEASFGTDEITNIHAFLTSERVRPLLSFLALALLSPAGEEQQQLVQIGSGLFENEVTRWSADNKNSWHKNSTVLWQRLQAVLRGSLPPISDDPNIVQDIANFSAFVATPLVAAKEDGSATSGSYLSRLLSLASNLSAITQAVDAADAIAAQIVAAGHEPIFTHAESEFPANFRDLYVERTIENIERGELFNADGLISSGQPFRAVLIGNPGAGKTTFIRHLVMAMATPEVRMPVMPTLLIRCRDYFSKGWALSINEYVRTQTNADLSLDLSRACLDGALLLGRIAVVFDGLDEITDSSQRADMARRVNAFTVRYPAVSILVTSREVGYSQAPLSHNLFPQMRLREFDDSQVEEYCSRWFSSATTPDLVDSFLGESSAIEDLRRNPLLLSLLCVLYREAGTIPANRRGVYAACAQLLFQRWDGRRQIKTQGALPDYGDRLMQEIARWFYSSPTAQAGVEENQIAKVIGIYMVQRLGFEEDLVEAAAIDFLNFCAGRAWLLGVVGTRYGQRLFAFTHRTFYEFFAAEALAREAGTPEDVCNAIRRAFEADQSSVLPELVLQSFDQRRDGAGEVMTQLCQDHHTSQVLLVRLMDGVILPSHVRRLGLQKVVSQWSQAAIVAPQVASQFIVPDAFKALLSLNVMARQQFVRDFLMGDERTQGTSRRVFLGAWSSLQLTGSEGRRHRGPWSGTIDELLASYGSEIPEWRDASTINWLLGLGLRPGTLSSNWQYLACFGIFGWTPGYIWWSIEQALFWGESIDANEFQRQIIQQVYQQLVRVPVDNSFPQDALDRISEVVVAQGQELTAWHGLSDPASAVGCQLRDILANVILAMVERGTAPVGLFDAVAPCWAGDIRDLPNMRVEGDRLAPDARERAEATLQEMPAGIREWASGVGDFVWAGPRRG